MSISRRWQVAMIAVMFVVIFESQLLLSVRTYSQTIDEGVHIFSGYQYWKQADFGANPEHPPLVKLVAAFPILFQILPLISPTMGATKASTIAAALKLLYENNARTILFSTRTAA